MEKQKTRTDSDLPSWLFKNSAPLVRIPREMLLSIGRPDVQRDTFSNKKVEELVPFIESTGVIPGILWICRVSSTGALMFIDGLHRTLAAEHTKRDDFYVRFVMEELEDEAAMGIRFVQLNTALRLIKPDDRLRALEPSCASLASLMTALGSCVMYDPKVRREDCFPISASVFIRSWYAARTQCPTFKQAQAVDIIQSADDDALASMIDVGRAFGKAWTGNKNARKMGKALNLTVTIWMYNQLFAREDRRKDITWVNKEHFHGCLVALASDVEYYSFISDNKASDKSLVPAVRKLKSAFANHLRTLGYQNVRLPSYGGRKARTGQEGE